MFLVCAGLVTFVTFTFAWLPIYAASDIAPKTLNDFFFLSSYIFAGYIIYHAVKNCKKDGGEDPQGRSGQGEVVGQ